MEDCKGDLTYFDKYLREEEEHINNLNIMLADIREYLISEIEFVLHIPQEELINKVDYELCDIVHSTDNISILNLFDAYCTILESIDSTSKTRCILQELIEHW